MIPHPAPFPDELLTSWLARQNCRVRGRVFQDPEVVLDRRGRWRLPDIHPPAAWLKAVSLEFGVPPSSLAEITIGRRHPGIPLDFLAWDAPPFQTEHETLRPIPRLHVSWCTRCLAEDYAAGQPAYLRRHWVLAVSGFCHKHKWPLQDRCAACGCFRWRLSAAASGPLRMICRGCWRPLERAAPETLVADQNAVNCWDHVIELEVAVATALRGRTPDQHRFNFTSADQLLNEVRDIWQLLVGHHRSWARTDIPLNSYVCPAMTPGSDPPEFHSSDKLHPMAIASIAMRRSMLSAVKGILDPRIETGRVLFGEHKPPAIETFVASVDEDALQQNIEAMKRWSPAFVDRVVVAQRGRRRNARIADLESRIARIGSSLARV